MHLRLGLVSAFTFAFLACSSDDTTSPATPAPDASTGTDAGTNPPGDDDDDGDAAPSGDGLTGTKVGEWTYHQIDGAVCANGTPTGIGVNLGTSKRLVIYLEGGGACWNDTTCYALKTAANLGGWDEAKFMARIGSGGKSLFNRTIANNPYKDASYVYIPYCTGDVHGGDKEQTYGGVATKHFGRRNMDAYLKRLVPTFSDPDRVVLTGASAGGFGAALNYWRVKKAFGAPRVDLVDDSGPPFPKDRMLNFNDQLAAWDLQPAIDPSCAECADGNVEKVLPHYSKTYPDARFALLSYDRDGVISQFYGISGGTFRETLESVTTNMIDPLPNARLFGLAGTSHTMLGDLSTKGTGKDLGDWLTDMNGDSDAWATIKPAATR